MASIVISGDVEGSTVLINDLLAKAESAASLSHQIDRIIEESKHKLSNEVFDNLRTNLATYKGTFNQLSYLCNSAAEAMTKGNHIFSDYISGCPDDDPVNARDHIPLYLAEIEKLKAEIEALEADIKVQELVQPTRQTWDDKKQAYVEEPNEPEYTNAQAQIEADRKKIEADQNRITYLKEVIAYLRRLDGEIDPRTTKMVKEVFDECRNFGSKVDSINVSKI